MFSCLSSFLCVSVSYSKQAIIQKHVLLVQSILSYLTYFGNSRKINVTM